MSVDVRFVMTHKVDTFARQGAEFTACVHCQRSDSVGSQSPPPPPFNKGQSIFSKGKGSNEIILVVSILKESL